MREIKKHIEDTLIHKKYFNESCLKMIEYLYKVNRTDDVLELARRCVIHDNSKLTDEEINLFLQLPEEVSGHKRQLTEQHKKLLAVHWKNNRHHPEYHDDCNKMLEIDIIEMCVDWDARSRQFGNNVLDYAIKTAKERFSFDNEMFEKVLMYCKILSDQQHMT